MGVKLPPISKCSVHKKDNEDPPGVMTMSVDKSASIHWMLYGYENSIKVSSIRCSKSND